MSRAMKPHGLFLDLIPSPNNALGNTPISFCRKDEVSVIVGPCSAKAWKKRTIPLDGRK